MEPVRPWGSHGHHLAGFPEESATAENEPTTIRPKSRQPLTGRTLGCTKPLAVGSHRRDAVTMPAETAYHDEAGDYFAEGTAARIGDT